MKKEEIIYVRILTVIGASALMALILIFGAGSGLFQRIANGINDTTLQLSNADAAIYSLYFIKDWMSFTGFYMRSRFSD